MMQLCWAILLISYYSYSESAIIFRTPGENITLKCSSEGRFRSNEKYAGMYLYHNFTEQNEVYFYSTGPHGKISVLFGYKGRTETNGTPANHDITITNLTVNDSGVYTCVYKESVEKSVKCNVYTVFVRGVAPCPRTILLNNPSLIHPRDVAPHPQQDGQYTLVLIVTVCVLSMMVIMTVLLLIIQRVQQRHGYDPEARSAMQESSDAYEVMTKRDLCPVAVSQHSPESPDEFD